MLKRLKFAAKSETLSSEQRSLLQDDVEANLLAPGASHLWTTLLL